MYRMSELGNSYTPTSYNASRDACVLPPASTKHVGMLVPYILFMEVQSILYIATYIVSHGIVPMSIEVYHEFDLVITLFPQNVAN